MNKMQMAHDYALKQMESLSENSTMRSLVSVAWQYADAMQAEADEREDKTRPEVLEEWQPDWSQAPDEAKYWAMDKDGSANFFRRNPEITNGNGWDFGGVMQANNTHGYTGNWQDSLRKRPEALHPKVDWRLAPEWANWWAIRQNSSDALWCVNKPTVTEDCFLSHGGCGMAPTFGFTGSHIVERPQ